MRKQDPAIYAILHDESVRFYIGSAVHHGNRWARHRLELNNGAHRNAKLQRAWNKYGEEAFSFWIVQKVEDKRNLLFWEQFWIDKLNPFFNIQKVADSALGCRRSEETKARISTGQKGRVLGEETRRKIGDAHRGKIMSEEARQKIGEAAKGRKWTDERRAKMSEVRKEFRHTEKTKAKLSEVVRARNFKPSKEQIEASIKSRAKTYRLQNPEGEIIEVTNLHGFCRDIGFDSKFIHRVLSGQRKSYKGWRKPPEEVCDAGHGVEGGDRPDRAGGVVG